MEVLTENVIKIANYIYKKRITDDYEISDIDERFKKRISKANDQLILKEQSKDYVIERLEYDRDFFKVIFQEGKNRKCSKCNEFCYAEKYCEICVRNDLKSKFNSWTSGDSSIDDLIKRSQMNAISLNTIVNWINFNEIIELDEMRNLKTAKFNNIKVVLKSLKNNNDKLLMVSLVC